MMVKVLIKRRFRKGNDREIVTLLNDLRSRAMKQPGYISGITLTSAEHTHEMLVVGTWQRMENWIAWKEDADRKRFDQMLAVYQEQATVYETYLVGTPFDE